jgi:cytochrome c oxidase subunit III
MNTATTILKAPDRADGDGGERSAPRHGNSGRYPFGADETAGSIALWVFIGVATALFGLFLAAYVMRMNAGDWSPIAMPRQLWLSTALLVAGSGLMHLAATQPARMRQLMLAGGTCALAFLGAQLWAWQALLDMHVMPAGNPAASFFYLLTAMHGLHMIGGIVVWIWVAQRMQTENTAQTQRRIGLCARYWHFLLAVWLVLYATFTGLTPELVAYICGR